MRCRSLFHRIFTVILLVLCCFDLCASQKPRHPEPKSEVLPLPKELPMALSAETAMLEFRVLPLLTSGGLGAQIHRSVNLLLRETKNEDVIKLRAFVAGPGDARRVQFVVSESFSEHKLPLPVVSIVEVGALQDDRAQVAMEATIGARRQLNPDGLVFFSGQTGATFEEAIAKLRASAGIASAGRILRCTCFTSRISGEGAGLRQKMAAAFPDAASTVVQALRDPQDDSTTCEAVGQEKASSSATSPPLILLPEARAAVVHADRLIFTGLQLSFGDYLDDAQEAFERLHRAASAVNAVDAPVQVNAFSPDPSSMAALRKTTRVPLSIFTVQPVEALPGADASAGVEEVLAPGVVAAVAPSR